MMPVQTEKAVIVLSGGLDSTTLLYAAPRYDYDVIHAVSFNYGQKHKKELEFAERAAEAMHVPWSLIDLWSSGLTELLSDSGSSLVDPSVEVPHGHYAESNMRATVVANRNMIMLSIAGAVAVAKGANGVLTGVHSGDHFVYPDCRAGFISTTGEALRLGNEGFGALSRAPIYAPFIYRTKTDIVRLALEVGLDFADTWSCYEGGEVHCGRCGTCVERLEAIHEANGQDSDTTIYADSAYWKTVTNHG